MRLDEPRIPALTDDEWDEAAREIMQPFVAQGRVFNIFRTLANHPDLARRWLVFGNHILGKSTLSARDREMLILRIGYLCQSGYEWGQHVLISKQIKMSDEEIRLCKTGPDTDGISEYDKLLLTAVDELHGDAHVSDKTWDGLSQHLNRQQMMDLVFTVGQYNLVSMALNSFGVQPDDGLPGWEI